MYLSGLRGVQYGMSSKACAALGGQWQNANPNVPTFNPIGNCFTPDVAPAAPQQQAAPVVTVTVPTNVNTNVSPQISPNLIQQQQPTNSPVSAGTTQTSTPQQGNSTAPIVYDPGTGPTNDPSTDAAMQALYDLLAQQAAPQAPVYSPAPSGGSSVSYIPEPSAPVAAPVTDYSKYLPYALAVAGIAFFALNHKTQGK